MNTIPESEIERATNEIYAEHQNSPMYRELGISPPIKDEIRRSVERYAKQKEEAIENVLKFQRDNR